MLNPAQRASLQRAINRLVKATVRESWSGAAHPDDRYGIELELARAQELLKRQLDRLTVAKGQ